jgi:hypothetical protein
MKCRNLAFIALIVLVLLLAGCSSGECSKDTQCTKAHFTATCAEHKCVYTAIPNECGNLKCEAANKENRCSCMSDCGDCSGKVGKYLVQACNKDDQCVQDIPATAQKPITQTRELSTGGSKISLTTTFKQPFNTKKDQIELDFGINVLAPSMSDIKITRMELTGMTPDKRTIQLSDKAESRSLFEGSKVKERLIVDFPTADIDGELTNLNLKVYLDYILTSGSTSTPKSVTLSQSYQSLKFAWSMPDNSSGCPERCEEMQGMKADCGEQTNFFCEYTPIAGACGNGVCDGSENKCTCPADCGPCTGGGTYLSRSCVANSCAAQLKQGVSVKPQSVFDERALGAFTLQNNYKYNSPFNIKTDKFTLELKLYQKQEGVEKITLKDTRLLDGAQEIAATTIGKDLTNTDEKQVAEFMIAPTEGGAEQERTLTIRVWYEYVQNNETKQGDFSKTLPGKLALLNPDV